MATTEAAARAGTGSRLLTWVRRHRFELLLVSPLVLYMTVLTLAPILDTIRISFTERDSLAFPSLASYQFVFQSEVFRDAVVNTVIVALLSLTLELTIGMGVALALHVPFRGRGFVRTVMLVPLGVPTIVSGAVMLLLFSRSGYVNALLAGFYDILPGGGEFQNVNWTSGGVLTLLTIAIADMWKVLPVVTLIFLAGLQSIPDEVYEAADVDGATKWQRFVRITLPLLIPYVTMALILRAIDVFRIFELALVIGGIRVAPVLGTYIGSRYLPPSSDPFTAAAGSM
ncbi:MAG TPA: sugar ABC transporter permease, partial [Actinomycetota bacterium]|nr:sugar ABC transporter permease [Actinomycetota bacterium]